jgi:sugar (pentulose or hexulose) kinase
VALEKSVKSHSEVGGSAWLLLAMTQWQLGDRLAAQTSYRQAIEWMEKNGQGNTDLRRLRAQAAALMDIKTTPSVMAAGGDEPAKQKAP